MENNKKDNEIYPVSIRIRFTKIAFYVIVSCYVLYVFGVPIIEYLEKV